MGGSPGPYDHYSVDELYEAREQLLRRLLEVPVFRRGSLRQHWRTCGKPNCHCAVAGDVGHGPRWQWSRSANGRTRFQVIPAPAVAGVLAEIEAAARFYKLVDSLVEVNEVICTGSIARRQKASAKGRGSGG